MKNRLFSKLASCAALLLSTSLYGAAEDDVQDNDIQALREWINTKRQVTVKELGGALSISGEVRTEFQRTHETRKGINQRGNCDRCGAPTNAFDVELNLMFDYRMDRSWAAVKLEFDNDAGVFHNTTNKIRLERCYFGVRAVDADTYVIDIEAGRRQLSTMFDSKIEFSSLFDGIFFKFDQNLEQIADIYAHLGTFLINDCNNQYAYVGEIGMMNVGGTGFYTKYSLIDWDTKDFSSQVMTERFQFLISQWIVGYRFLPSKWTKAVIAYAAGLYNHAAKRNAITGNIRANLGGYIGFTLGELKKRNDWSLDINYQVVAPQAIPDFDVVGIGLGNACRTGFYTAKGDGSGAANTRQTAGGNTNYQGYTVTLDYLLLNNLNIQQNWSQSVTLFHHIGPFRHYNQYELEFIYAF